MPHAEHKGKTAPSTSYWIPRIKLSLQYTSLHFLIIIIQVSQKRACFSLVLTDVQGLEPAQSPLSAPAHNLSSASDQDEKEAAFPDSTSPASEDTVTQSERYSLWHPWVGARIFKSVTSNQFSYQNSGDFCFFTFSTFLDQHYILQSMVDCIIKKVYIKYC